VNESIAELNAQVEITVSRYLFPLAASGLQTKTSPLRT